MLDRYLIDIDPRVCYLGSSPVEYRHDSVSCAGIQACGGFIQEQHGRRDDELHANVGSLPFTTWHTTDELIANLQGIWK